jgi:hypothetical protein
VAHLANVSAPDLGSFVFLGALCLGQIANLGIKKDLQLNGRAHYFYLHSS